MNDGSGARGFSTEPDHYPTYYDLPSIRVGHWRWLIIGYFWCGGIAGGSYLIAAIAHLFGSQDDQAVSRWGRYVAFVFGAIFSPILLVLDLGRPERFYNMLRVFKARSAMSVGSFGLSFFAFFASMSAFLQLARDGGLSWIPLLARLGKGLPFKPFEAIGTFFGLFMSGYTGVLISQTAVPLWARSHRTNGPLFLSSALATASAAISLVLALTRQGRRSSQRKLSLVQAGAMLAESALLLIEMRHLGPLRDAMLKSRAAPYTIGSMVSGLLVPLALTPARSRTLLLLKGTATLLGGFLLRAAIVLAGHESARDPRDYFWFTDNDSGRGSD